MNGTRNPENTCQTCEAWDRESGSCHMNPPQGVVLMVFSESRLGQPMPPEQKPASVWPPVPGDAWCMQHRRRSILALGH